MRIRVTAVSLLAFAVFFLQGWPDLSSGAAEMSPLVPVITRIPAGEFTMVLVRQDGTKENRQIYLNEFSIDVFEASIPEYAKCVFTGKCSPYPLILTLMSAYKDELMPPGSAAEARFQEFTERHKAGMEELWVEIEQSPLYLEMFTLVLPKVTTARGPIGYLEIGDAVNYCASQGRYLPTNAQWEKAARGDKDGRMFPWGDEVPVDCAYANLSGMFSPPLESCPNGPVTSRSEQYSPSPYGLYNMVGNQREFIVDIFEPTFFDHFESKNPVGLPKYLPKELLSDHKKAKIWRFLTKGTGYTNNGVKRKSDFPLPPYLPASISDIDSWYGRTPDSGVRCVGDLR